MTRSIQHVLNTLILLVGTSLIGGCSGDSNETFRDADKAKVEKEVRAFLKRFDESLSGLIESDIRAVYVDQGLTWYEDGALRYQSVEEVLEGVKMIPEGMQIATEYSDVQVEVHDRTLASVRSLFDTKVTAEGNPGFGWAGAMTMLVRKQDGQWRVSAGHSSTPSPRGG